MARASVGGVRVVLADPPSFTPQYDHELAAALARAGADVELVTCRSGSGEPRRPAGYRRDESLYPVSSRLFRRSPLRLPLRAVEHLFAQRALARLRADVVHLQWLAWPERDRRLPLPSSSFLPPHHLPPRGTPREPQLRRGPLARFARAARATERP